MVDSGKPPKPTRFRLPDTRLVCNMWVPHQTFLILFNEGDWVPCLYRTWAWEVTANSIEQVGDYFHRVAASRSGWKALSAGANPSDVFRTPLGRWTSLIHSRGHVELLEKATVVDAYACIGACPHCEGESHATASFLIREPSEYDWDGLVPYYDGDKPNPYQKELSVPNPLTYGYGYHVHSSERV